MSSAVRLGLGVSGRELCDIGRVLFKVTKSLVKILDVLAWRKYTKNLAISISIVIGLLSQGKDVAIFDT